MKQYEVTRKKASVIAAQRSIWLRTEFQRQIAQYAPDQLVFCDESAVTEASTRRRWAWSSKGRRAVVEYDYGRAERWSLLPLLSISGFLRIDTIHGAYNKESFEDWIYEKALPVMNAYPHPNSVLIMDNCPIHDETAIRAMCNERSIRLLMLPPYSPDYNPIENAFGLIKHHLQEYYQNCSTAELPAAMLAAAQGAITGEKAAAIHRGCGYWYLDDSMVEEAEMRWQALALSRQTALALPLETSST